MAKLKTRERLLVVGICGSLREGSLTRVALGIALAGAATGGARTKLIDLRDYQLTFCDGKEDESRYPADVFRLRAEVREAAGIILATPEYHGGYSGVLKNALDLMGFDEFEGKMVGLVGVSGGRMGASGPMHALRDVARALHAWVIPEQASVAEAGKQFDVKGRLKDVDLEKRLRTVGSQVARFSRLHNADRTGEFVREMEAAAANPGG